MVLREGCRMVAQSEQAFFALAGTKVPRLRRWRFSSTRGWSRSSWLATATHH